MSSAEIIAREVRKIVDAEIGHDDINGRGLHERIVAIVEKPLMENVLLRHCRGNQSHAAAALGLSRNTLKKKMVAYGLK